MAKLIGTGKDPRFPKGQDYDVPEHELQHHIDAKLGEPVEPGTEAFAVHRGYDTIAADPGEQAVRAPEQEAYGSASRVAARVETTAGKGRRAQKPKAAVESAQKGADEAESPEDAIQVEETEGAKGGAKSGADKVDGDPEKAKGE